MWGGTASFLPRLFEKELFCRLAQSNVTVPPVPPGRGGCDNLWARAAAGDLTWPFLLQNTSFLEYSYVEQASVICRVLFSPYFFLPLKLRETKLIPLPSYSLAETLSCLSSFTSFPNFPCAGPLRGYALCSAGGLPPTPPQPCSFYNQDLYNPGHLPVDAVNLLMSPLKYSSCTWM